MYWRKLLMVKHFIVFLFLFKLTCTLSFASQISEYSIASMYPIKIKSVSMMIFDWVPTTFKQKEGMPSDFIQIQGDTGRAIQKRLSKLNPFKRKKKETTPQASTNQVKENTVIETTEREPTKEDEALVVDFQKFIDSKRFDDALELGLTIPSEIFSDEIFRRVEILKIYKQIDLDEQENNRQFGKDESMAETKRKTVNRLIREGKYQILQYENELAKNMLIQAVFLDRKNYVAKQILDRVLGFPRGTYNVENVEAKYYKDSLIFMYSGLPLKAIEALKTLEKFNPQNAEIFERMGSAYYSSGQPTKAIKAWNRALYLAPESKKEELKVFIKNAKEQEVAYQKQTTNFLSQSKNDQEKKVETLKEFTTLRIVVDSNTAYSYAQQVREQMPSKKVMVEELDNGKWAVKIEK